MSNRRKLPKTGRFVLSIAAQAHVDAIDEALGDRRFNVYGCATCGGVYFTVDLDRGVTPMLMRCWATEGCQGQSASAVYPVSLARATTKPPVTLEWYRPDTLDGLTPWEREHVETGGLLHRPAETAPLWVKTEHWARG